MFLNKKPSLSMIEGKCAGLRAKNVSISGQLPVGIYRLGLDNRVRLKSPY
jgi:hypothetical protein